MKIGHWFIHGSFLLYIIIFPYPYINFSSPDLTMTKSRNYLNNMNLLKSRTMSHEGFTTQHRMIGRFAAWAVFFLLVAYAITLVLGLLSLKSPQDPIGDPFFSILELLIVLMAPLMVVGMVAVHAYASPDVKAYSLRLPDYNGPPCYFLSGGPLWYTR